LVSYEAGEITVTHDEARELLELFRRQEAAPPPLDARRLSQAFVRIRASHREPEDHFTGRGVATETRGAIWSAGG